MRFQRTLMVVGKGPSAPEAARRVLSRVDCDVAVINDAGKLLPVGARIDWCCWTDTLHLNECESFHERVGCFVSPKEPFWDTSSLTRDLPILDWFPRNRAVFYADQECPNDRDEWISRIAAGRICHHHTTAGAVHWLCKHAWYNRFIMAGIDGGTRVATGAYEDHMQLDRLRADLGEDFRDDWNVILRRMCELFSGIYGITFEWEKP